MHAALVAACVLLAIACSPLGMRYALDLDGPLLASNELLRGKLREAQRRVAELEAQLTNGDWVAASKHDALRERCLLLASDLLQQNTSSAALAHSAEQAGIAKGLAEGEQRGLKQCPPLEPAFARGVDAGKAQCPKCPAPSLCATQLPPPPPTVKTQRHTPEPSRALTKPPLILVDEDPSPPLAARNCDHAYEFGLDRVGAAVIAQVSVSSGLRCKKACSSRADCEAWAFSTASGDCRLLRGPGRSVEAEGYVSGVTC